MPYDVNRTRQERRVLSLSIGALGTLSGVNPAQISMFERGIIALPDEKVRALQCALYWCQEVQRHYGDAPIDWRQLGRIRELVDRMAVEKHAAGERA